MKNLNALPRSDELASLLAHYALMAELPTEVNIKEKQRHTHTKQRIDRIT